MAIISLNIAIQCTNIFQETGTKKNITIQCHNFGMLKWLISLCFDNLKAGLFILFSPDLSGMLLSDRVL